MTETVTGRESIEGAGFDPAGSPCREGPEDDLRILILTGDTTDAGLVERELRRSDLEFASRRVAGRGPYLEALDEFRPTLILADYDLPDFDGIEALTIARARCPGVPFLFVSRAIGEDLAIETLKQGATDYVLRNRLSRLVPAVKRAVGEAQERAARREVEEALRRSEKRHRVLLEINNAVIANLDRRALFDATARALRKAVPFDRASFTLYDADRDKLRVSGVVGGGEAPALISMGSEFPREGSHLQVLLDERRPVVMADLESDETASAIEKELLRKGIRSYVAVPLIGKRGVVGTLNVGSHTPEAYSSEDATFLQAVAEQIALAVENMLAYEEIQELRRQLELENTYLREEVIEAQAFGEIVGQSAPIRRVQRMIQQVAPTEASVLILGESGTGKELVAREIHQRSDRGGGPMIKVNCASVPRELYESEFFGHVKGAFTGAVRDRAGRFEAADGGTLFLDEVGEIPFELQGKLLRVLQEGAYERVGDTRTRSVDVRIIAATNQNLEAAVDEGRFRADLFYRLNVFPIRVPPLRARKEDIPVLAAHFLERAARQLNRPEARLSEADVARLKAYDWPGNVRELQNVIERAVITSRGGRLRLDPGQSAPASADGGTVSDSGGPGDAADAEVLTEAEMERLQRENIRRALEQTDGKIYGSDGAAELLELPPTTLASRIKRMGLSR